jgi:hypothetical protein
VLFDQAADVAVVEVDEEGREDGVGSDQEETVEEETLEV